MKTIKQIADELGISKQRVYRYVHQNHISDVHQKSGVIQVDDVVEKLIIQHFSKNNHIGDVHHDVHQNHITDTVGDVVLTLQKQLEVKDKQIENLQRLLDQEQQLHAATKQLLLPQQKKKGWIVKVFEKK